MLFSSCAKKKTELRRTLLVPANVLIGDPAAEWMRIGVPMVLQQDFLSSRFTMPMLVRDESNAGQMGAQDLLRIKVEDRQGKIHVTAAVVDAATQKQTSSEDEEAASQAALIPALDKLAKDLDSTAGQFSSHNIEAVKLLVTAGQEQNPPKRYDLLKQALAADPNFGMCYFLLVEMAMKAGPDAYKDILAQGRSHLAAFPPFEKARFQLLDTQLSRAPLTQRTAAVENLLKVAPNDLDALSIVSGIRFLNGDLNGGVDALKKAVWLSPQNVNLKLQLAEGLVQSKRFAEAEKGAG